MYVVCRQSNTADNISQLAGYLCTPIRYAINVHRIHTPTLRDDCTSALSYKAMRQTAVKHLEST